MRKRAAFRSGFLRKRPEFALPALKSRIKIGVSNRRANGPLMQLNVNFNGSRRLERCPWIVATDAQCDGQVPCSRKNFGPDLRPFPTDLWCSTSPKRRARWMPRGPSPPRQSVRQHGCTDRLGERPLYPSLRSDSRRTGGSPGEKRPRIGRSA